MARFSSAGGNPKLATDLCVGRGDPYVRWLYNIASVQ